MASDGSMSASEKAQRDMVARRTAELGPDHPATIKVHRVTQSCSLLSFRVVSHTSIALNRDCLNLAPP